MVSLQQFRTVVRAPNTPGKSKANRQPSAIEAEHTGFDSNSEPLCVNKVHGLTLSITESANETNEASSLQEGLGIEDFSPTALDCSLALDEDLFSMSPARWEDKY